MAAIVIFVAGVCAQGKNFAGKWTPDAEKNAPAGGGGGRGGGMPGGDITIAMDAKTMTLTRVGGNGDLVSKYNLDGSESKNMQGPNETSSKCKWEGDKLVVDTTSQGPNGPQVRSVKWYLEAGALVQETQRPGRNGGAATATKTYYKAVK